MANTHNAYSDLIHLFIDGEATETERNILFGALKDSPELQEEFSSAMKLKKAFAADIMQLQPPSYLESQIAERAGLIVAASASAASAPVLMSSVSTMLQSAAPVATMGLSKVAVLFIGATVGVLSTIGIMRMTSNDNPQNTELVASQNLSGQIRNAPPVSQSSQQFSTMNPLTGADMAPGSLSLVETQHAASLRSHRFEAPRTPVIMSDKSIVNQVSDNSSTLEDETLNNNADISLKEADISSSINPWIGKPIASTDPLLPAVAKVGWSSKHHDRLYDGNEDFLTAPDWFSRVSFSYRMLGMGVEKLFQGADNLAAAPPWNGFGGSLKYELDPFQAVALEGGLETFPVYLSNKDGGFDNHRSIAWGGVSYTYSASLLELWIMHPQARILTGWSSAGPIAKLSTGLVFNLSSQMGVSVDPEATFLAIKDHGSVKIGEKLGLTGSVIFHF